MWTLPRADNSCVPACMKSDPSLCFAGGVGVEKLGGEGWSLKSQISFLSTTVFFLSLGLCCYYFKPKQKWTSRLEEVKNGEFCGQCPLSPPVLSSSNNLVTKAASQYQETYRRGLICSGHSCIPSCIAMEMNCIGLTEVVRTSFPRISSGLSYSHLEAIVKHPMI